MSRWLETDVGLPRRRSGATGATTGLDSRFGRHIGLREARHHKLVESGVKQRIEENFALYQLPRQHRRRMKSIDMPERYNDEVRRRTRVVRIFPIEASCLRLIRALAVETHDQWITGKRYRSGRVGLESYVKQPAVELEEAA